MKVERISTRVVTPCAPPSQDVPCMVALSSIDLGIPPVSVPTLYVYRAPSPPTEALERGLSKVLSQYREFAGRLTVNASRRPAIHLNDQGAILLEAQALVSLQDMTPFNPSLELLDLLPPAVPPGDGTGIREELLVIQVTKFTCGGLTLGIETNHQVADGEAASEFFQAWASAVRGVPIACPPLHDRSALTAGDHPDGHVEYYKMVAGRAEDSTGLVLRRLHFGKELLRKIKVQASSSIKGRAGAAESGGVQLQAYSTFVSLTSHVWKCVTIARGLDKEEGDTVASIAVNIRKRLVDPELPRGYYGNAICYAYPKIKIKDLVNEPLSYIAARVHAAIAKVDSGYVRSALAYNELMHKNRKPPTSPTPPPPTPSGSTGAAGRNTLTFTPNLKVASWTSLPGLHDFDFGWGAPLFAVVPHLPYDGHVVFSLPSPKLHDGGIDVNLALFAPHMQMLESICFELDINP